MKIEIVESEDVAAIREDILDRRGGGVTLVLAKHSQPRVAMENAIAVLKDFVQHVFGLSTAFETLPMLTRDEAVVAASSWLTNDLSCLEENLPSEEAQGNVMCFLALFANPTCFTTRYGDGTWHPVTKSTFDAALLVMDATHAGFLVVQDDD
jgi:hypothetical protein